jgi:hypothetical protein
MKANLLLALTLLAASPALRAIDADGNGLSDVYEFIYFHGSADPPLEK